MPLLLLTVRHFCPQMPLLSPNYNICSPKYLLAPEIGYFLPTIPSSPPNRTFLPQSSNFLPQILLHFLPKKRTSLSKTQHSLLRTTILSPEYDIASHKIIPRLSPKHDVFAKEMPVFSHRIPPHSPECDTFSPADLFPLQNTHSSPTEYHWDPQNRTSRPPSPTFLPTVRRFLPPNTTLPQR